MSSSVLLPQSPSQRAVQIVVKRKNNDSSDKYSMSYRSDGIDIRLLNPDVRRNGSSMSPNEPANTSSLVAVRNIEPGEKLFAEKAFLSYDTSIPEKRQIQSIRNQISRMTRNQSSALSLFFSLPCLNNEEYKSESKDLLLVDRHSMEYDIDKKGVFVLVSKCRHSCAPNVEISMLKDGVAVAHATKFIEKGTEITCNTLGELNIPYEKRKDKFKSKYLTKCSCFVCAFCVSDKDFCVSDDSLRRKIAEAEDQFYILMKDLPHEAVSIAHKLIGVLIQSAVSENHFQYTDIPMLRRLHLRVSTLCMKNLDGSQLSVQHLKYAAAYCAVGLGWTNPETLKVLSYLEKRSVSTISFSELPIFNRTVNEEMLGDFLDSSLSNHEKKIQYESSSKDSRNSSPSTDIQERIPDYHYRIQMPKHVPLPNIISPLSIGTPPPERYKTFEDNEIIPDRNFVAITAQLKLAKNDDKGIKKKAENTEKAEKAIEKHGGREKRDEGDENASIGAMSTNASVSKKVSLRIPHVNIGDSLLSPKYSMGGNSPDGSDFHLTNHSASSHSLRVGKIGALSTVNICLDGVSDDENSISSNGSMGSLESRKRGIVKGRSHILSLSPNPSPDLRERQRALSDDEDDMSILTPLANDDGYQNNFNTHDNDTNSPLSTFSIWASKNKSNTTRNRNNRKSAYKKAVMEEQGQQSLEITTSKLLHIKKSSIQTSSPKNVGKSIASKMESFPSIQTDSPKKIDSPTSLVVDIPGSTVASVIETADPVADGTDDLHFYSRPITSGAIDLSSRPNTGIDSNTKKALI